MFEDVSDAPGATRSVWVRTVDGAPPVRLGEGRPLDIAPDGQWVAATITGPPARLALYPTGPGTHRMLGQGAADYAAASFLPDGKRLLIVETSFENRAKTPFSFKLANLMTGAMTTVAPESGTHHVRHAVAPDGRSLLVKRQGGGFFVVPLGLPTWRWEDVQAVSGLGEPDFPQEWTGQGVDQMRQESTALRIDPWTDPNGRTCIVEADRAIRPGRGPHFRVRGLLQHDARRSDVRVQLLPDTVDPVRGGGTEMRCRCADHFEVVA